MVHGSREPGRGSGEIMRRRQKREEHLEKMQADTDKKERRLQTFQDWHHRVLEEAPQTALARRNDLLTTALGGSNAEIERYHQVAAFIQISSGGL